MAIDSLKPIMDRSSRPEVFCKKDVFKNFAKFTGKHLCQSFFFNRVFRSQPATFLKKRLWDRCFPVNFVKFLRLSFLTEHLRWLLLHGVLYLHESIKVSFLFHFQLIKITQFLMIRKYEVLFFPKNQPVNKQPRLERKKINKLPFKQVPVRSQQ